MSGKYIPDVIMNNFRHLLCSSSICMDINNRRDFRHPSKSVMINNHYKHSRMIPWFAHFSVVKRSTVTNFNLLLIQR